MTVLIGFEDLMTVLIGFGLVMNVYIHRDMRIGRHGEVSNT